jgi:septal ring factor EnvC (AmiA/AmiB activator)
VTAAFGQPDPWGRPGHGVTLSAPAYAQVSAPWDGTIRFAGPLIDYGNVVVLEPEEGTLIVLAGLAEVDRLVGETVLAGERLGDLGGPIPDSDEFLLEATTDRDEIGAEKLYIEVRRAGQPVDPALWFNLAKQGIDG